MHDGDRVSKTESPTPTRGLGRWHWLRTGLALFILTMNVLYFITFVREVVSWASGRQEFFAGAPAPWPAYVITAVLYAVSSVAALAVPWARSRRRSSVLTLVAAAFLAAGVAILVRLG